jgi:aminoglycoside phosphotransferase (APT) family kinase protein
MLPDRIAALLAATFPESQVSDVAPTSGGFSNLTLYLTIGGAAYVLKAADTPARRIDVRREARVLQLLAGCGLPVAECHAFAEDAGASLTVMPALPGVNGIALYGGDPAARIAAYRELGALLARVHALTGDPHADADLDLAARAAVAAAALPDLFDDPALCAALQDALQHPAWRSGDRLVHGDAGLHNTLWDGRLSALLDWEWAGWGNPQLDLAWIAWTMRFRQVPEPEWYAFLAAYRAAAPSIGVLDPATLRALALGQIAGILTRVAGRPAALAEWLRRARWSLDIPFPAPVGGASEEE